MQVDTFAQLQELVRIIKQAGPLRSKFFSREKMSDEALGYARLYKYIANHPDATEAQVAEAALGVGPKDNAYLVQRTTLKDMLYNTLYAIDVEAAGFSPLGVAVYENDKDMFGTRILQTWSWPTSIKVAERALPVALEYERWHNALLFLDALREAAAISGDMHEFNSREAEFNRVLHIYTAAQEGIAAMERIICHSARSTGEDPTLVDIARPAIAKLKRTLRQAPCFTLSELLWRLETAALQSVAKYRESLNATRKFESLVKADYARFLNRSLSVAIGHKRAVCALRTRDYAAARIAIDELLASAHPSELTWLSYKQLQLLLFMQTAEYQSAAQVIEEVHAKANFKLFPAVHRDKWSIFEAYVRLAQDDPTLKFNRRVLDTRLQKDKAGTNAAAIVLELLLLLRARKLADLGERTIPIESYVKRHLTGTENEQIRTIFDLLLTVSRHAEDRTRLEQRIGTLLKSRSQDRSSDPIAGFQIIPIETLWSWITRWLFEPSK